MSWPQLSTLAIYTSGLLFIGFFLHWIHGIEVNKRYKENHKTHEWIPFGLASNMACWTLFCLMPKIYNYRSFLILGPLAHMQLVSDAKTRATQHKMTRFHRQITHFMPHFTRVQFAKISTLIHTNSYLFVMCELPFSFPINRGSFFLDFQAWIARKTMPRLNPISLQNQFVVSWIQALSTSNICPQSFIGILWSKLHHHFALKPLASCFPFSFIVDLWSFSWKGSYELNPWANKLPLSSHCSTYQKPPITIHLSFVLVI